MYYYIREAFARDPQRSNDDLLDLGEGFCNHLEFKSELLHGKVYLDGYETFDLGVGDIFTLDTKPEY